jgi:PAS domain S-box-containing protein
VISGLRRRTSVPRARAAVLRYVTSLAIVAATVLIIPRTPLDGPVGGLVAVTVILACAWFGGTGPALLFPSLIFLLSWIDGRGDSEPEAPTGRQLITFGVFTVLTAAVGLAGQYRRRIHAVTQRHAEKLREQARVLSLAHIIFRDLEGRITEWNEGAERMFGWSSAEAQGRVLHELLETRFPKPLEEIREELLRTGQWEGEVVHRHKNGSELTVAAHWIAYRDKDGLPVGVAEVQNDVTALRRAEEAIREADRRKDRFLATLAHELRNPLAPLASGLDMLGLSNVGSPVEEEIRTLMQRQVTHMVHLIDDLLDVSRINTGKIVLRPTDVMLGDIVRDAIDSSRPHIDAAGHELTVRQPSEAIPLRVDRARLTQVLLNLLNNAAKFTPAKGRIELTVSKSGDMAEIRVRDNGAGISAEMLPRVFDMFVQSEDLLVRTHGGLGIGLSIARTLVELHGGVIEAHSGGAGLGTEFIVRLPVPSRPPCLPAGATPDGTSRVAPLKPRRILVVDDNRDAAQTLAMLLTSVGCECRSVFDGPTALETATQFLPDAFVLDIGLPGMCGYEVARRLRATPQFRSAVMIAVTGWGKDEDRREAREAGFDHHLVKPVELNALYQLLSLG